MPTLDLYLELRDLVRALDDAQIDYAFCGAIALAVHGVPRATKDIDLLALPADETGLRACARRCGFTLEALPTTFSNGIRMQRLVKLVKGRPLMLDILWVEDALAQVWKDRETLSWEYGSIRVVSRAGLITLKITSGRPQDLVDVQRLSEMDQSAPSEEAQTEDLSLAHTESDKEGGHGAE